MRPYTAHLNCPGRACTVRTIRALGGRCSKPRQPPLLGNEEGRAFVGAHGVRPPWCQTRAHARAPLQLRRCSRYA